MRVGTEVLVLIVDIGTSRARNTNGAVCNSGLTPSNAFPSVRADTERIQPRIQNASLSK
jgi:hypothetical protein